MGWALNGVRFPAPWNEGLATLIDGVPPRATGFADVDLPPRQRFGAGKPGVTPR
jgi:hypothetical protein